MRNRALKVAPEDDTQRHRYTNLAMAEFQHEGKVCRFGNLPKEGEGILPMVTTEFAPQSHGKVASENLTLAPMQSAPRQFSLLLITVNYVTK